MTDEQLSSLLAAAAEVRGNAHAPYSGYGVGAAVLGQSGRIYVGCNVENASYGATLCAERSAIAAMVAAGETSPRAVAIRAGGEALPYPCGICRQVIWEFGSAVRVLVASDTRQESLEIGNLLPKAFEFER